MQTFLDLKMYVPIIFIFKPLYELTTKYLKFFGPPEDFKLIASYDLSKMVPYSFSHVCPKYLLQKISPVHKMFLAWLHIFFFNMVTWSPRSNFIWCFQDSVWFILAPSNQSIHSKRDVICFLEYC